MSDSTSQIEGSGELVSYPAPFKNVGQEDTERAAQLEQSILDLAGQVDVHYLKIAAFLSEFKRTNLYLARGYETFKAWADSPDLKRIGYRTAHNLVRIVDEALPILQKHNAMHLLPPMSTMYDLLPILSDENGEQLFLKAVEETQALTNRDAKQHIKALRGMEPDINEPQAGIFKASVQRGETYHRVKITFSDGIDFYNVGTLMIKPRDWPRWEARFGAFVEMEDA